MTTTKYKALVLIVACAGALGFMLWRVQVGGGTSRPHYYNVILGDPSDSKDNLCGSLTRLAEQAVAASDTGGDFDLVFYRLGDASSANAPVLVDRYHHSASDRSVESKNKPLQKRLALVEEVRARCEQLPTTDVSPVFQGVRTVIQQMRSDGCGGAMTCRLLVSSDLMETVERPVQDALNDIKGKKRPLPDSIDNAGIRVKLCGYAQTVGRATGAGKGSRQLTRNRTPKLDDRLRETWLSAFSRPELVELAPFCQ